MAAGSQPNEVEEVMKTLKHNPGVCGYIIMNNEGIVLRYESMSYTMAVQHAALVLSLCSKAKQAVRRLLDPPDNEVESMRLHTRDYEMIVAQLGFYTMIVIQETSASAAKKAAEAARAAAEAEGAA